jgi:hypothetical protein
VGVGGVYVFIGATASAMVLKGLEVHWRWLYSCCSPSALGVLANAQGCNLAKGLFGLRTYCPCILSPFSLPSLALHFYFLM